jgi:hypothetical protein
MLRKLSILSCLEIRNQNAGKYNIKIGNRSLKCVEHFKYLGTTLSNQNPFVKKLRADEIQEIFATFRCRIFCVPVCYPVIQILRY